ncbi:hypothetical protein Tco_0570059 [Tanacetum coccineum]
MLATGFFLVDSCLTTLACRLLLDDSCLPSLACIETMKFLLLALLRIKIDSDFLLLSLIRRSKLLLVTGQLANQIFLAMNHEVETVPLFFFLGDIESLSLLGKTRLLLRPFLLLLALVVNRRLIGFRRSGDLANRLRFWGFLANLESILWIDLVCGSLSPSESGLEPFVASDFFSLGRDVGFA